MTVTEQFAILLIMSILLVDMALLWEQIQTQKRIISYIKSGDVPVCDSPQGILIGQTGVPASILNENASNNNSKT